MHSTLLHNHQLSGRIEQFNMAMLENVNKHE